MYKPIIYKKITQEKNEDSGLQGTRPSKTREDGGANEDDNTNIISKFNMITEEEVEKLKLNPKIEYLKAKSHTSSLLSDVTGFVFGPFSSRFWLYRQHFNSMEKREIVKQDLPFFAWQCLTLHFKNQHKQLNLVIKNEKACQLLLRFFILHLRTIDGIVGSLDLAMLSYLMDKKYILANAKIKNQKQMRKELQSVKQRHPKVYERVESELIH